MTIHTLRKIYEILLNGEYSIEELTETTGFSQKTVRLGIQMLQRAGYVNGLSPPENQRFTTKV